MESQPDEPLGALRETSLASRRLRRELGMSLPLLRESIAAFVRQAECGYRDRIRRTGDTACGCSIASHTCAMRETADGGFFTAGVLSHRKTSVRCKFR